MRKTTRFTALAMFTLTFVPSTCFHPVVWADNEDNPAETNENQPAGAEPDTPVPSGPPMKVAVDDGEKGEGETTADSGADEEPKTEAEPPAEAAPEKRPASRSASAEFAVLLQQWKEIIKSMRDVREAFHQSPTGDQAATLRTTFDNLVTKGEKLIPQIREAGIAAYVEAPNEDRELTWFLHNILEDEVTRDAHELAFELAETLLENDCDLPDVVLLAGIAAYGSNRFEKAEAYLQQAQDDNLSRDVGAHTKTKVFGGTVQGQEVEGYLQQCGELQVLWDREQDLREKERAADNLPRVRLVTTEGDIELELFENEAPDTVGNFINLVEKDFYKDMPFHRVLPAFMAQTGCPNGDGTGGPGYKIYDECERPEHRHHFAGSVSMAKEAAPDTGGSQFFICFVPTPHLNGKHTVFGRVIKGMDVLPELNRNAGPQQPPANPDLLIKAEVIRKNEDKKYVPRKVTE